MRKRKPVRQCKCRKCRKRKAYKRDQNNKPICRICDGYKTPSAICSECGKLKSVHKRDGKKVYCKNCYSQPKEICYKCKKLRRVISRENGKPICVGCYTTPIEICNNCGIAKPVHKRDGEFVYCSGCYKPKKEKCSKCEKKKGVYTRIEDKKPICRECADVPARKCIICNRIKPVHLNSSNGPICFDCYIPPQKECSFCLGIGGLAVSKPAECGDCYQIGWKNKNGKNHQHK